MTKMQNYGPRGGGVCRVFSRCKRHFQCSTDTKVKQVSHFSARLRSELSPLSPTHAKYRGQRKPAWIGLVPCVPCVPYSKSGWPRSCACLTPLAIGKLGRDRGYTPPYQGTSSDVQGTVLKEREKALVNRNLFGLISCQSEPLRFIF